MDATDWTFTLFNAVYLSPNERTTFVLRVEGADFFDSSARGGRQVCVVYSVGKHVAVALSAVTVVYIWLGGASLLQTHGGLKTVKSRRTDTINTTCTRRTIGPDLGFQTLACSVARRSLLLLRHRRCRAVL